LRTSTTPESQFSVNSGSAEKEIEEGEEGVGLVSREQQIKQHCQTK
jgi:hypothetical protein